MRHSARNLFSFKIDMPFVAPTGDANTFSVTSADDKDHYVVVIASDEFPLVCSCRDWQFRCYPKLRTGEKIKMYGNTNRNVCKHIDAVLKFLAQSAVAMACGKERTDIFEDKL